LKKENLTEAWKEFKTRQNAKRVIFSANEKKQEGYTSNLNYPKHQNE